MTIVINGSGEISGISVGGLPDDIVDSGTLASDALDSAVTINDTGADVDFRVESDDNANMIFVDGGNDSVGIGTGSPHSGAKLHIVDGAGTVPTMAAGDVLTIQNNDGTGDNAGFTSIAGTAGVSYINFGDSGDKNIGGLNYYHSDNTLRFYANASERMRITSSGTVHIGTTSEADGSTGGVTFSADSSDRKNLICATTTTSNVELAEFRNPNGTVGTIKSNGSSTSFNTSSDYRLKENVVPMTDSIDRLKELNPSRFNFIADADKTVDGFLAHEVSDYVPEAISGEKDAMRTEEYEVEPAVLNDDGNIITEAVMGEREVIDAQGIDQSKLVPLLTGALQEAVAKIEELTTRIETLENA
jgi:hypothetical protein